MPARLPTVGGDTSSWGAVLNTFLSVAHTSSGSLNAILSVKDANFGAKGDGLTDDTAAIAAARAAANAAGGGIVFYPPGTYLTGNQTLYNYVVDAGAGIGATIIRLKAGTNTDLFSAFASSINLSAAPGTGSATGVRFFGMRDLTLDGNKANQSGGPSYPIRGYGYGHMLTNVEVVNGYSGGILLDWNNVTNPSGGTQNWIIPVWQNVTVHDCTAIGIQIGGPTDMQWTSVNSFENGSHCVHICPNAVATQFSNCHFWAPPIVVSAVTCLIEAYDCQFTNCQIEGSDTCQLVLLGGNTIMSGSAVYTDPSVRNGRGIQLGQLAGQTPIPGQIFQSAGVTTAKSAPNNQLSAMLINLNAGALDEENTSGNQYNFNVYQTAGNAIYGGGYLAATSQANITVEGLTPAGDPGTGGIFQLANVNSFNGFRAVNKLGVILFNIDTYDSVFQVVNGFAFSGYSDGGTTLKYTLDASTGNMTTSGRMAVGQSATAVALAASGTIATANIGVSRVAPTGNVASIILAAGTIAGQQVTVVNESAFTVTFAAAATSNVADGTLAIIAANRQMEFTWDSSTSRWYHS